MLTDDSALYPRLAESTNNGSSCPIRERPVLSKRKGLAVWLGEEGQSYQQSE